MSRVNPSPCKRLPRAPSHEKTAGAPSRYRTAPRCSILAGQIKSHSGGDDARSRASHVNLCVVFDHSVEHWHNWGRPPCVGQFIRRSTERETAFFCLVGRSHSRGQLLLPGAPVFFLICARFFPSAGWSIGPSSVTRMLEPARPRAIPLIDQGLWSQGEPPRIAGRWVIFAGAPCSRSARLALELQEEATTFEACAIEETRNRMQI
jgi:hypothetical protein